MTIEADIYTALKGLVGNRCYPDVAPQGVARPYIVYQQAGGEAPAFVFDRTSPSKKNGRFQVSVWADNRLTAASINLQIEAAFVQATAFDAKPTAAPVSLWEEDTGLYGSTQDFSVWSDR